MVWGTPKSGKTFWALDVCFHVAMGKRYRGLKVEQGSVVYCAFEGQSGMQDRVAAYRKAYPEAKDAPLWIMPDRLTFTRPGASSTRKHRELVTAILNDEIKPVLVVLDTLNRSLDGSESSDEDMTFYTKAAEEIADTFSCVVLIVHHCGINKERPRGHTSLTGTCACQIIIERISSPMFPDERMVSSKVEYIKDGPEGLHLGYFLKQISLGIDEDGNDITSCVIAEAPATILKKGNGKDDLNSPAAQKALAYLQPLCSRSDEGWVKRAFWKEIFMHNYSGRTTDAKRKAFDRGALILREKGIVEADGEMVRIAAGVSGNKNVVDATI